MVSGEKIEPEKKKAAAEKAEKTAKTAKAEAEKAAKARSSKAKDAAAEAKEAKKAAERAKLEVRLNQSLIIFEKKDIKEKKDKDGKKIKIEINPFKRGETLMKTFYKKLIGFYIKKEKEYVKVNGLLDNDDFKNCDLSEAILKEFMNDNGGFLSLIMNGVLEVFERCKAGTIKFKDITNLEDLGKYELVHDKNTFKLEFVNDDAKLKNPIYTIMKLIYILFNTETKSGTDSITGGPELTNFTMYIVMTRFLDIVVKQGEGIVTSLEHIKYFFLHASINKKSLLKYNEQIKLKSEEAQLQGKELVSESSTYDYPFGNKAGLKEIREMGYMEQFGLIKQLILFSGGNEDAKIEAKLIEKSNDTRMYPQFETGSEAAYVMLGVIKRSEEEKNDKDEYNRIRKKLCKAAIETFKLTDILKSEPENKTKKDKLLNKKYNQKK